MRPLSERMKDGELYVIYTGWGENCEYISMLTYGDRERTPRIYKQGAVDGRIPPSTPICNTLETANMKLGPKTLGVALPLSEMIQIFKKKSVSRWAREQRAVSSEEVREYVRDYRLIPIAELMAARRKEKAVA